MKEINVNEMSVQQRRSFLEQLKQQELADRQLRDQEVERYKGLVTQTVNECFPQLQKTSAELAARKTAVRGSFAAVLDLKSELFGVKGSQRSHQFMNDDSTKRITIGYNVVDDYDDTVEVGIAMVRNYIESLVRDDQSRLLVETVMKLLSKDNKGTLKASRVLQLQQMADKSGNESFIEGVRIIRDAYKPTESKSYIRAEFKDATGAWVSVPLGMTEAE